MKFAAKNLLVTFRRYRTASILNLTGLILGFTVFLIVLSHIRFEYGVNQTITDNERIFRLEYFRDNGRWEPNFSRPVADLFLHSSPHIEQGAIWIPSFGQLHYLRAGDVELQSGFVEEVNLVSPDFPEVFSFQMIEGSADVLREPDKILIPESMARKFFGEGVAYGQHIRLTESRANENGKIHNPFIGEIAAEYTVGGVYKDFPEKDLLPNHIYAHLDPTTLTWDWYSGLVYVYVKLNSAEHAARVCEEFLANYPSDVFDYNMEAVRLTSVRDIYFTQVLPTDVVPRGDKRATTILLLVSLLIMAIAVANYINFSIALTGTRIRSINTRKVLGSTDGALRLEIISESAAITLIAFLIALSVVTVIESHPGILPIVHSDMLAGLGLPTLIICGLAAIGTGILAGIYPALHMTSFPPSIVLNNAYMLTGRVKFIRKTLVGCQYVISFFLIIYAVFIQMQNDFMKRTDLGFNKERLLVVRLSDEFSMSHSDRYREMLRTHPGIEDVAFSLTPFYSDGPKSYTANWYNAKNHYHWQLEVSHNFPKMMGIRTVQGRDLRREDEYREATDEGTFLFNEAAAREMELVPGESVHENGRNHLIAGIFPDFHFESMHRSIEPMGFFILPKGQVGLPWSYIRTTTDDLESVKAHIRHTVAEIDPAYPVDIQPFDASLERMYEKSTAQSRLITLFTAVAVLLSVIGVFGLVIFESQNRRKEIVIRKVFGATIGEILFMLNGGFTKMVLICFVIAVPFSFYGVRTWLNTFAYHVPIGAGIFFGVLVAVLILTVVTVTYQSYRVAVTNPSSLLRQNQ